jgi:R67 dihydrofolate reductase
MTIIHAVYNSDTHKLVPIEPTTVQVNAGVDADDLRTGFETVKHIYRVMALAAPDPEPMHKFREGQRVRKTKGSSWQGRVVGFYSTDLTPIGYCVESEREPGSVQIYPEGALEAV